MKLEIEVIRKELITPSSPTPSHLNNYKLSFLDQIMPSFFVPFLSFYPSNNCSSLISNAQKSHILKKSLSQALYVFFPLAGRLVENCTYINCNDEGVTYVEAHANCMLSDVITDLNSEELIKLYPFDPLDVKDLCMAVQATFFRCGGLALGIEISHKVCDGFSDYMFLSSWAAFSLGNSQFHSPKFESAILFPPKEESVKEIIVLEKMENIVTKRFVFSPTTILQLQDKHTTDTKDEGFIRPTKLETLLVFIATRFMVATSSKDGVRKVFALRIFSDIRTKIIPPLSENHFGNSLIHAIINVSSFQKGIVKKMRDAIRKDVEDSIADLRQQHNNENDMIMLSFTNFCNFHPHIADFGWGIPMMIWGSNISVNNMVSFTKSLYVEGGIDVWVNLKDEDMAKFEVDEELLAYVSDMKQMSKM